MSLKHVASFAARNWWDSRWWREYEEALCDKPGSRIELLKTATWDTRIVNLHEPARMWPDVRKSYRSIINGGLKSRNICAAINGGHMLGECQQLHADVAGRVTRPARTWELMDEWLDDGLALVALLHGATSLNAYAYFIVNEGWAYYASAATTGPNLNHALVWTGMCALQRYGVNYLEMGWQGESDTDKGKAIEFFRSGFGGEDFTARIDA